MDIKIQTFAEHYIKQVQETLDQIDIGRIEEAIKLIANCRGTVWLIGNGGSAALASHMATDLQLAGKRAIALTDMAAITTYANDDDFIRCFSRQLDLLAKEEDVLIIISGSGNSQNLQDCAYFPGQVIAVTGFNGGDIGAWDDIVHINIPANHMGVSQDGHQIVLHILTYFLMERRKVQ